MMVDAKVSVILDKSSEVRGRQAVNTIFCFYDKNKNAKQIILLDTSILRVVNSMSLSLFLGQVLQKFNKDWDDLLAISTDLAEYMNKLVKDLQKSQCIHVAVNHALCSPTMNDIH